MTAMGESLRQRGGSSEAAAIITMNERTAKAVAALFVILPAGMERWLVRGLAASMAASAQRLKAIAAERAATIAITIHKSW